MSPSFAFCAAPAASGSWPSPDEVEDVLVATDPVRECLRSAQAALQAGQLDLAVGWFRHASALDESLVLPRVGAALCLVQAGRDVEGASELMQAYAASAKPGEVDATLARVYVLAGHREAACSSAKDAVARDPSWAPLLREDAA